MKNHSPFTINISLLAFCILLGCSSVDKQIFKATQTFDKYPNEAAIYCGNKFPVADSLVNERIDTIKGKEIDLRPALVNLEQLVDSAKSVIDEKQGKITDMAGQLSFAQSQLGKEKVIIIKLISKIDSLKSSAKPCGVDTIKNTVEKIRANTAKIMALTAQTVQDGQDKEKLQQQLTDAEAIALHRLYWLIGIGLVIAAYFGIKIYSFFSGGAIVNVVSTVENGIKKKL